MCLEKGQDVSECLRNCGCLEEAQAARQWSETPSSSCSSECVAVCEDEACVVQCARNFCATPLPVAIDVLLLVLLLGVFYFAYMLVPKSPKRGRYWRSRVMETQYKRLDDY